MEKQRLIWMLMSVYKSRVCVWFGFGPLAMQENVRATVICQTTAAADRNSNCLGKVELFSMVSLFVSMWLQPHPSWGGGSLYYWLLTSLVILRLYGVKFLQPDSKILQKNYPEKWMLFLKHIIVHGIISRRRSRFVCNLFLLLFEHVSLMYFPVLFVVASLLKHTNKIKHICIKEKKTRNKKKFRTWFDPN